MEPDDEQPFTPSTPQARLRRGERARGHRLARVLGADDPLPIDPDLDPRDPGEPSRTHVPAGRTRRARPATAALIAAGGFVGTLARYEVSVAWPSRGGFPLATWVINTSGAFVLGLVLTVLLERHARLSWVRPLVCVGLLGSWTTMSSLALDVDTFLRGGHVLLAGADMGASLLAGFGAVTVGIALGRRRWSSQVVPATAVRLEPASVPGTVDTDRAARL